MAINAGGEFVVLWYGFGDSSGGILHARRFRPDGGPATDDIRVADQIVSTNENLGSAIQDDGSFLVVFSISGALKVAWSLFSGEVSARVFSPEGAPLGPVVTADTTSQSKFGPRVAMGPRGEFVVVWQTFLGGDPSSGRLLGTLQARRYGPGSHPRGEEVLVSDHYVAGIQVAKDGAGNFLVIWSEVPDAGGGGPHGIYGRRFSPAGAPLGAALPLVPSFTTGYRALAMAPDGSFVIAWDSTGQGGFEQNVFAQVFPASGVPLRPAFSVPQRVAGIQRYPWVAINGEGRFVVVWADRGNLSGRRFKARRP